MRLLLVTNDYPPKPGGIQQYLGNLATRFEGEVRVLAPADDRADDGGNVVRGRWPFMWPTPSVRHWAVGNAREFKPDVILFGAPYPLPWLGPALSDATGAPFGVLAHGAEITVPAAFPISRQLVAAPLKRAGFLLASSKFTARAVGRLTRRRADVLGVGVDLEAFHPHQSDRNQSGEEVVVGSVSRFVPRKHQDEVIEAADRLAARGHRLRVTIVGRGRLESKLRRRAATAGVPVDFHVDVPWHDLPGLYRRMDVFAVPTRSRWLGLEAEGLGIVFLEAAASGLPVIAGSSGGAPETVRPGETGYVVHDYRGLEQALEHLVEDPHRRTAMGAAGRRYMEERFTWPGVMERLNAALERAVNPAS